MRLLGQTRTLFLSQPELTHVACTSRSHRESPGLIGFAYPHPRVSGISPSCGPVVGETQISVRGTNFTRGSHLLCRFAVAIQNASLSEASVLACVSPPAGNSALQGALNLNLLGANASLCPTAVDEDLSGPKSAIGTSTKVEVQVGWTDQETRARRTIRQTTVIRRVGA